MKLLFDQNLSPRLPILLGDLFPGSVHVRQVGLHGSEDSAVWDFAKKHGYVIVSKDSDFQQRALLYGAPPKFVWLRLGNCSVADSAALLRVHSPSLHTFDMNTGESHLILP